MNTNRQPAVDLAEIAAEVVSVMFEEDINQFMATMEVMKRRGLDYGQALKIAEMANEIFKKQPKIAAHVKRKHAYVNQSDAIFHEQLRQEEEAMVLDSR